MAEAPPERPQHGEDRDDGHDRGSDLFAAPSGRRPMVQRDRSVMLPPIGPATRHPKRLVTLGGHAPGTEPRRAGGAHVGARLRRTEGVRRAGRGLRRLRQATLHDTAGAAVGWFARNQNPDGTWLYRYDRDIDTPVAGYNITDMPGSR